MDTDRLKQFLIVASTQNMREASEILRVTHSALSKSMRKLQEELQQKIFIHEGRGIVLTQAGRELIPRAEEVLRGVSRLQRQEVLQEKMLTIATFEVFSTYFAATLAATSLKDWSLNLVEAVPGQMENLVLGGRADLAISYEPIPMAGLMFRKICTMSMHVYATKKLLDKNLSWRELPFAVPAIPLEGSPSGAKGLDGWNDAKYPRHVRYRIDLLETALALCRANLCAICAPDFVMALHNKICEKEHRLHLAPWSMPEKIQRSIFTIQRKGEEESSPAKKVAAMLRQLVR